MSCEELCSPLLPLPESLSCASEVARGEPRWGHGPRAPLQRRDMCVSVWSHWDRAGVGTAEVSLLPSSRPRHCSWSGTFLVRQ